MFSLLVSLSSRPENTIKGRTLMDTNWHLVYTKPQREREAEFHLGNQGFSVYLPRHKVGSRRRGRHVELIQPLFPRYLFVELTQGIDNWSPIRSTRGVAGLVRFGAKHAVAPRGLIDYLQLNEKNLEAPAPLQSFGKGDRVYVATGPFAGYEAVFQCERGEDRALVLLNLISQFSEITLSVHDLEKAV